MGFLKELFALTRFEHAIMLAVAVLIAETIVLGELPPLGLAIALSLLVPVFSEMGSFALNDYLDIGADRANKMSGRPLVKGTLSPAFALRLSIACLAASTVLAFFINTPSFLIALAFNALAVLYNWKLKDLPLVGNVYIALTMAIPFIFGNFVVSQALSPVAASLAALGFVAGLSREILKSVEDMEGDAKARKSRTLPLVIGERPATIIAAALYLLFVPLAALPFVIGLAQSPLPMLIVALADIGVLYIALRLLSGRGGGREALRMARKLSLGCLFLGLIGLLLASLS